MDEKSRIAALQRYRIADIELNSEFDDFTVLAAQICHAPMAVISFVDETHHWFKSRVGIAITEYPRCNSFCEHVVNHKELLVIGDTMNDERFCRHPLVMEGHKIRFYAGAPLITADGHVLGSLCVMDDAPHELSSDQSDALIKLSRLVMHLLNRRIDHEQLKTTTRSLLEAKKRTDHIIEASLNAIATIDTQGRVTSWNPEAQTIFGWSSSEVSGQKIEDLVVPRRYRGIFRRILGRIQRNKSFPRRGQNIQTSALNRNAEELPIELRLATIMVGGEPQLLASALDLRTFMNSQKALQKTSDMLAAVGTLQSEYITRSKESPSEVFEDLLQLLLEFTESEYGFVAEVLLDEKGAPYMKTHAITDISWNEEMRAFFEKHKAAGLEFRNLKTLFGVALVTGQPVISNQPSVDPRRGGLPPGHPPLDAYLGVPIWRGDKMIAMVGVSNRPGGYDMKLVKEIEPLLSTYATIIRGYQVEKEQTEYREKIESLNADLNQRASELAEALETNIRVKRERLEALQEHSETLERRVAERTAELEHSKRQFQDLFEYAPDALVLTDELGIIRLSNSITEEIFGWSKEDLLGRFIETLLTPELQEEYWMARSLVVDSGQKATLQGRKKSGQDFPLELSISPVNMGGDRWFVTAMRDVSERARLEQELARISSHEQERLAHELHDHLGAYLAGIALRFKTLAELLEQRSIPEAEIAMHLIGQVNDAINQVRNFARLLAPVDLETGGLAAGLSQLAREMKSIFHIKCEFHASADLPPVNREHSMHLYRIAQEASRNALHHGKAKFIEIRLVSEMNWLVLSITSDGKSWTPDFRQTQGMGLRIMRHRAVSMGGQLTIQSSDQGHTTVACRIPATHESNLTNNPVT